MFEGRNRVSDEQRGDVESKSVVQACLVLDELDVVLLRLVLNVVVILGFYIFVLRDVVVDSAVPRLRDVGFVAWISFIWSSAVDALGDDRPSQVVVGKLSFENWSRGR